MKVVTEEEGAACEMFLSNVFAYQFLRFFFLLFQVKKSHEGELE